MLARTATPTSLRWQIRVYIIVIIITTTTTTTIIVVVVALI